MALLVVDRHSCSVVQRQTCIAPTSWRFRSIVTLVGYTDSAGAGIVLPELLLC